MNTSKTEQLYELFLKYGKVSTDSRKIDKGAIFFALHGDNFDANHFAAQAVDSGACCAVVDDPNVAVNDRFILVPDTLKALQDLASHHRQQLGVPILAITGSNGKTTTKELAARVLAKRFKMSVTKGNLNNHIGVPLTILAMDGNTQFGIVEMGASSCREIELLCSIAKPDYGIITNIGKAHLEGFGGESGVKRGKGELLDYLNLHHGLAFYPTEDKTISQMVSERNLMAKFGFEYLPKNQSGEFLSVIYKDTAIDSHLIGEYNRYNISSAVAIGEYFHIPTEQIKDAIESYLPDNNRSQRHTTKTNTLVLDCYNANPSSMNAALENFSQQPSPLPKAVILGDMLELGEYSHQEHQLVVDLCRRVSFDKIILVGDNFSTTEFSDNIVAFTSREKAADYLKVHPLKEHFVLIKGSRGIGLERLVELL